MVSESLSDLIGKERLKFLVTEWWRPTVVCLEQTDCSVCLALFSVSSNITHTHCSVFKYYTLTFSPPSNLSKNCWAALRQITKMVYPIIKRVRNSWWYPLSLVLVTIAFFKFFEYIRHKVQNFVKEEKIILNFLNEFVSWLFNYAIMTYYLENPSCFVEKTVHCHYLPTCWQLPHPRSQVTIRQLNLE